MSKVYTVRVNNRNASKLLSYLENLDPSLCVPEIRRLATKGLELEQSQSGALAPVARPVAAFHFDEAKGGDGPKPVEPSSLVKLYEKE